LKPKYPKIKVQLTGRNGNAFVIMGAVISALRREGVPEAKLKQFIKEATAGDYDNVLQTAMKWVDVT
jgi:hypothetical protein